MAVRSSRTNDSPEIQLGAVKRVGGTDTIRMGICRRELPIRYMFRMGTSQCKAYAELVEAALSGAMVGV